MSYAAIITHVQADPAAAHRLDCAIDLARRFDATLIGIGVELVPLFSGLYGVTGEWTVTFREAVEARIKDAGTRFRAATVASHPPAVWLQCLDEPTTALAKASLAADLIVAGGAPARKHDAYRDVSSAVLAITAGRPVLVVPPQPRRLRAQNIVLAWKDTREARRAMSDALPLLQRADQVLVTEVCHYDEAEHATRGVGEVVAALERHGVKARPRVVQKRGPTGFDLLEEARQIDADLIVSGAYGHSRLNEWSFGGFTDDLLSQNEVFLLLSH